MPRTAHPRRRAVVAALAPLAAVLVVVAVPAAILTVAVPAANATTVPGPPAGWTTVFSDNFSGAAGTGVNTANWLYDTGTGYPGGAANWGTGEVETMTNSTANVYQDGNGHLVIKPVETNGTWTSGRIETQNSSFEAPAGGEMEMTASIEQPNPASGLGYWPAFWAMGSAARGVGAHEGRAVGRGREGDPQRALEVGPQRHALDGRNDQIGAAYPASREYAWPGTGDSGGIGVDAV